MPSDATRRNLRNPPITAEGLTDTKWETAADKARFANGLLRLIAEDFRPTLFTKAIYHRLSMTFGMIAHYDRNGFAEEWFGNAEDRRRFVEALLRAPCHGSPEHTHCDVERAIQDRLRQAEVLAELDDAARRERTARDRATYERLRARFEPIRAAPEPGSAETTANQASERTQATRAPNQSTTRTATRPTQASLFDTP